MATADERSQGGITRRTKGPQPCTKEPARYPARSLAFVVGGAWRRARAGPILEGLDVVVVERRAAERHVLGLGVEGHAPKNGLQAVHAVLARVRGAILRICVGHQRK